MVQTGIIGKIESYTVTKVTEFFWQFRVKWELVGFVGVEADSGIVLLVFFILIIYQFFSCSINNNFSLTMAQLN